MDKYPKFPYILSLPGLFSIHIYTQIDLEFTHFTEHNVIETIVYTIILLKVNFLVLYYERTLLHQQGLHTR